MGFVLSENVRRCYDINAEREWNRLVQDGYHRLELIVTLHFLDKHLPEQGLILDADGGPGTYTIELARKGYEVVLYDLSPKCLEKALKEIEKTCVEHKIKKIAEDSIINLSEFGDQNFNAVLFLGTISHLINRRDRDLAASELVRVTKKEHPCFFLLLASMTFSELLFNDCPTN